MKLRLQASPAGGFHIGNARIALLTWLLARRHGGQVLLRGEAAPELEWLGLDWDATIDPADHSDRMAAAIDRLKVAGRLYPCFESEEELNAKRDHRQRRGESTIYDRAMLKLTAEQRHNAEAGGKRPHWRFLLSGVPTEWGDMVLGRQSVKLSAISDPVLVLADGTPSGALAAAVEDMALGITHVLGGEDRLTGTGIQLDLLGALGARGNSIRFAHLPLLVDAGGKRLKRTGALSLRSLRADGVEPAALVGLLARLGTPADPAPITAAALAPHYDLSHVGKQNPRFDPRRLLAVNREALAAQPFDAVRDRLPPTATPAFWSAVRGHLDLLREARGWWDVVSGSIVPPLVEDEAGFLHEALQALPPEPWDGATWSGWTGTLRASTGRKGRQLSLPLRLALTGEEQGPGLEALLPLMGRARVAERLMLAAS